MAKLRFRITSIALDEDEEVSGITAVVRDDTHQVITGMVGAVDTSNVTRGGTEMTITMPVAQMSGLLRQCGKTTGEDPRAEHTHEIYDSLNWLFCSLMDD